MPIKHAIAISLQKVKEEITVEVRVYKLPKFEVELEAPSFIHPKSSGLTVSLKAT